MAYFPQGSTTSVTEQGLVCVIKFDDDLPNGPFVEGSAGNFLQPGSMTVSVPSTGATWGQVAELVAAHHQKELDAFCDGGKMKDMGGGHRVGNLGSCTGVGVTYKGGKVSAEGEVHEGSCTVQISVTNIRTDDVCCTIL